MKNSFPKTLYRTPRPEFEVSEVYELSIEPVPGAEDPHCCWIVREVHGHFNGEKKTFEQEIRTLNSTGHTHFLTCEEAIQRANEEVLVLAQRGFHYLFVMSYTEPSPPWHERYELKMPEGDFQLLP